VKHIQYLLEFEKSSSSNLRFDRVDANTIYVSSIGYVHQELMDVEAALLKLGCRYDTKRGIQKFDKMCGRTFTFFKEPKTRSKS